MTSKDETKVEGKKLDEYIQLTLAVECRKMHSILTKITEGNWKQFYQLEDVKEEELFSAINLMKKIVNKTSTVNISQ